MYSMWGKSRNRSLIAITMVTIFLFGMLCPMAEVQAQTMYTLTYYLNGGSGNFPQKSYYPNVNGQVATASPTRSSYKFNNWKCSDGNTYKPGASILMNGSKTLTAQWTWSPTPTPTPTPIPTPTPLPQWTLTYDDNLGSGGPGTVTVTHGTYLYITPGHPTRNYYDFRGWASSRERANSQIVDYTTSSYFIMTSNITVFAVWSPIPTPTPTPRPTATPTVKPTTTPEFIRIDFEKEGSPPYVGSIESPYNFKVTCDVSWIDVKATSNLAYTISVQPNPDSKARVQVITVEAGPRTIFYEVNQKAGPYMKRYTVTFNAQGGSCDTKTKRYLEETPFGSLPLPNKREGYVFAGWYSISQTGLIQMVNEQSIMGSSDITLYAQWNDSCTVTFEASGGYCSTKTKQYAIGQKMDNLPTPIYGYYTSSCNFTGWYTKDGTNGGIRYTSESTMPNSDITLYARWEAAPKIGQASQLLDLPNGAQNNYSHNKSIKINIYGLPNTEYKVRVNSESLSNPNPARDEYWLFLIKTDKYGNEEHLANGSSVIVTTNAYGVGEFTFSYQAFLLSNSDSTEFWTGSLTIERADSSNKDFINVSKNYPIRQYGAVPSAVSVEFVSGSSFVYQKGSNDKIYASGNLSAFRQESGKRHDCYIADMTTYPDNWVGSTGTDNALAGNSSGMEIKINDQTTNRTSGTSETVSVKCNVIDGDGWITASNYFDNKIMIAIDRYIFERPDNGSETAARSPRTAVIEVIVGNDTYRYKISQDPLAQHGSYPSDAMMKKVQAGDAVNHQYLEQYFTGEATTNGKIFIGNNGLNTYFAVRSYTYNGYYVLNYIFYELSAQGDGFDRSVGLKVSESAGMGLNSGIYVIGEGIDTAKEIILSKDSSWGAIGDSLDFLEWMLLGVNVICVFCPVTWPVGLSLIGADLFLGEVSCYVDGRTNPVTKADLNLAAIQVEAGYEDQKDEKIEELLKQINNQIGIQIQMDPNETLSDPAKHSIDIQIDMEKEGMNVTYVFNNTIVVSDEAYPACFGDSDTFGDGSATQTILTSYQEIHNNAK